MTYRIACQCGKSVFAEEMDAGARLKCGCGRVVSVPNLSVLLRMPPAARREEKTSPRPTTNSEASRHQNTGLWAILVGIGLLVAGNISSVTVEKSPGACLDLVGVGAIILGVLRLGQAILARNKET